MRHFGECRLGLTSVFERQMCTVLLAREDFASQQIQLNQRR
jgi:hypothetical protein